MSGTPPGREREIGFTSELGLSVDVEGDTLVGRAHVVPEMCIPTAGTLRPSVLLSWADTLAGSLATERTLPRVCMTVDLDVRVVGAVPAGVQVRGVGRILKTGRVLTFTETTFLIDGSDEPTAFVLGTFVASPRPEDTADSFVTQVTTGSRRRRSNQAPTVPITDILGAREIAPGVVEADRHPRILNWVETVQGGAVALLAEEAALSLPDAPVPTELEVRYLRTVRVGPMRATAHLLGGFTQIEVIDVGNADRLAAVAISRG
jgi:acyl-coenzyme A thioesterase PaaI-like protein